MTSPQLGFGSAPMGSSSFGFGVASTAPSTPSKFFVQPDGTNGDAAYIDPTTRDFVLDGSGQKRGWSSLEQRVYLALVTDLGTATDQTLGTERQGGTITPNLAQKNEQAVRKALKSMTDAGEIEVVSVTTTLLPNKTSVKIEIQWRESATGAVRSTFV